ncbi:hypothetical protein Dsin_019012 [Dipteronia sinensis]|uniref:DUF4283 domain-containing protein n=1 Tax=Dipteronia sinensis TaxID=43782 RepID=A0AAE0A6J6_9ROSI|nr:hypothetical protein Dsin_019012 [Dipteronia sinensis]
MNTEDIALLCNALSIMEKRAPAQTLDIKLKYKGEHRLLLCLVGKIMATKLVNKEVFMDVMSKIWRVNDGVEIEAIEGNIFSFHFKNTEDKRRVQAGGPWTFGRAAIIFEEPHGSGDILNTVFDKIDFLIQVHQTLLLCMMEEIRVFLGELIGEVRDIDLSTAKDWIGRFLRVRVTIVVNQPLRRSLRVDLMGTGSHHHASLLGKVGRLLLQMQMDWTVSTQTSLYGSVAG